MQGSKNSGKRLARYLCIALAAATASTPLAMTAFASVTSREDVTSHYVGITGSFNGWGNSGANDVTMTDGDGDGVYEGDVEVGYVTEDMLVNDSTIQFKVRLDGSWDDNWGEYEYDADRTYNSQENMKVDAEVGEHLLIHVTFDTTRPSDAALEANESEFDENDYFIYWPVSYTVERLEPEEEPIDEPEPEPADPTEEDLTGTVTATTIEEMQSPHNYYSHMDKTWVYKLEGADYVRFTFSEDSYTEGGCDTIYVQDADGNTIKSYSGSQISGLTLTVPGDTVRIRLQTDGSEQEYGFRLTEITQGNAEDDVTNLGGTVTVQNIEDLKSQSPLPSGMEKTWAYHMGDNSRYAVRFSDDTLMDTENDNDYIYVYTMDEDGEWYYDSTFHGNSLAGKTLVVYGSDLYIKVVTNSSASTGFKVESVKDINIVAQSVEDLQASYDSEMTDKYFSFRHGIESSRLAVTFSEDSKMASGYVIGGEEGEEEQYYEDYIELNGERYYDISGKTVFLENYSDILNVRSYMSSPDSKFRIVSVKDANIKAETVDDLQASYDSEQTEKYFTFDPGIDTDWLAVTFSDDSKMVNGEFYDESKDQYNYYEDYIYVNGTTYRDIAGKTITVNASALDIHSYISSPDSKFRIVSVKDANIKAETVDDLQASYDSEQAEKYFTFDPGIDTDWLAVTFSDDSKMVNGEFYDESKDQYNYYEDYINVNGTTYRDIAGKTILVNASALDIHSYISSPDSKFKITSVRNAVYTVQSISEMKSAQPANADTNVIYSYTIPETVERTGCVKVTFSEDTGVSGDDYFVVNGYTFRGQSLAGKTLTFEGNTLTVQQFISSAESRGFEVTAVEPGNYNDVYSTSGDGTVSNDYLSVYASYSYGGTSYYHINTTGGDPDNDKDNGQRLLYNTTSRTTVDVDGSKHYFGEDLSTPYTYDNEQKTITGTEETGDISVKQEFAIVNNASTDRDDVVRLSYTYTNNGSQAHTVGLRIGFDTMLGGNDSAPFRVPGTGDVTTNTEYSGSNIPQYWQAFDDLTDPSVLAQGSFTRDARNAPDRVRFCSYGSVCDLWDGNFYTGDSNDDSGVLIFWENRTLQPGESITFSTYYGLSELSQNAESMMPPLALSMYGDKHAAQIDYNDETQLATYNQPIYTAYLNANGTEDLVNAEASIVLPDGFSLAEGSGETVKFDNISVGDIKQADWKLVIDPTKVTPGEQYEIKIIARADPDVVREVTTKIRIPSTLVQKTDISGAVMSTGEEPVVYTGEELKPVVVTYGEGENANTLVEDANYTITYENNIDAGRAKATITGIGMYKGEVVYEFDILPQDISGFDITVGETMQYTGEQLRPDVAFGEGLNSEDYNIEYGENRNVGEGTVTVTHKSTNYTGTKTLNFRILPKPIDTLTFGEIENVVYNGTEQTPAVSVTDGNKTLTADDYTVRYLDNVNAGTATAVIEGIGNYTGTVEKTFTILPKDISTLTGKCDIASTPYTGTAITPACTLTDGDKALTADDFTVSYSNNVNAGTASAVLEGKGNYTGTLPLSFTITPIDVNTLNLAVVNSTMTYTGAALESGVTAMFGQTALTAGTDYTVSYADNVNAGKASAVVKGVGNFTGEKSLDFTIAAKNVSALTVSLAKTSVDYTGSAQKPAVTVKDGSKTLKANTDYTVAYKNNTKAGKATVTVTCKGNYTGTKTLNFTIKSVSINKAKVTGIKSSYTANGKAQKPTVKVKLGTKTLKLNTDYTVKYSNNKNPGKAKVVISGKGNYSGKITKTFKIQPKKTTLKKLTAVKSSTKVKTKKIKVTWTKDTTVDGYQVVYSTSSSFKGAKNKIVKSGKTSTVTLTGLKKNTKYYVKIRAYKNIDGKKVYSDYGNKKNIKTVK